MATLSPRTSAFGCVLAVALLTAAAPADPLYRLTVGQVLTYADHESVDYGEVHLTTDSTAVYHVVGRTTDGAGWHLVGIVSPKGEPTQVTPLDLWPDGRVGDDRSDEHFLPLPPTATATRWERTADFGATEVFRPAPATRPATFAFTAESSLTLPMVTGGVVRSSQARQATFGLDAGVLVHAARQSTKSMGTTPAKEDATVDLTANVTGPAADAMRFAGEADAFMSAQLAFDTAMVGPKGTPDREAAMARGLEPLLALQRSGRVTDGTLVAAVRENVDADRDRMARELGMIGRPAPAWDLPDLAGARHTLAEQRGKVVVLDFWYRACPPCVAAMPGLQRLADRYAGRPVAFFGMNTDRDARDAQAIVDRCGTKYPTLRLPLDAGGRAVAAAYLLGGCPRFVVIGPDGVVRLVREGYGPTTDDDLAREIDTLVPSR
jgi:thiol-disulfide isomerase/thioredoxin